MKRFLILTLAIVMLLALGMGGMFTSTTPAFAQARYGLQKSAAVQTSTALVLPAGTWVYGIEIFADGASSFMGVYNCATLGTVSDALVKDEIGEATQYDTQTKLYPKPIYFGTGVTVVITTGVGFILYGPHP